MKYFFGFLLVLSILVIGIMFFTNMTERTIGVLITALCAGLAATSLMNLMRLRK